MKRAGLFATIFIALMVGTASSFAAELVIYTPRALWTVLNEVGPEFERSSGHKLKVTTDIAETLAKRIEGGDVADIYVGPPPQINRLIQDGHVVADTRVALARAGIGVQVRAGAPKPDISSLDAFKRALLNAKSIGYLKTGASGLYLHGVFERIGIADAIKHKVVRPETDTVSEKVAKGEIELDMGVITQIMTTPGVELVGPVPSDIQSYVRWFGGVCSKSKAPDAAKSLLKFVTDPSVDRVLKAQGMERH